VKCAEVIRRVRKYAKANNLEFIYDPRHGKGSHGRIHIGDRLTTVKSPNKRIGVGLLRKMLRDLDITPEDF